MILRYFFMPEDGVDATAEFLGDFCRRTGCRDLLLFTSSYEYEPSLLPLERTEEYLSAIAEVRDRLRPNGVRVHLNVLQTLGHVYLPENVRKEWGIQPRIDIDGAVSDSGACPLCPNLRAYLRQVYRRYAEFNPPLMFVDDDYRYVMGGLNCFCPLHLAGMSRALGRDVSLEAVRASVLSPFCEEDEVKRAAWTVLHEAMVSLATEIERTVHAVAPECEVGLMTALMPHVAVGMDVGDVTRALAGPGGRPFIRPQINMYQEEAGKEMAARFLQPALARSLLPPEVDHYPEIENWYHGQFAKSDNVTYLQMETQYFLGFDNLAVNLFAWDRSTGPSSPSREATVRMLERARPAFERTREAVGSTPRVEGVRVIEAAQRPWRTRCFDGSWRSILGTNPFLQFLPNLGLAVGFDGASPFQVLTGDTPLALAEDELESVLRRGAVLDARALECLEHLGHGERIGVRAGEALPEGALAVETFVDRSLSPTHAGSSFTCLVFARGNVVRRLEPLAEARELTRLLDGQGADLGPGALATENERGERFVVLAPWSWEGRFRATIENHAKQELLRNAFEWIGRAPLPLVVLNAPYVSPFVVSETAMGRRLALIVNFSSEPRDALELAGAALEDVAPESIEALPLLPAPAGGASLRLRIGPDERRLGGTPPLTPFSCVLLAL